MRFDPTASALAHHDSPSVRAFAGVHSDPQPDEGPTAFAPVNDARFGTAGFNSMRGPGVANWDLGLHRRFQLRGNADLQFRAEAFNVTNTPKFDNPRSTAGSSGFGEIASSYGERELRLGLRLGF